MYFFLNNFSIDFYLTLTIPYRCIENVKINCSDAIEAIMFIAQNLYLRELNY